MKIIISGYGRMGRQIEKTALYRYHTIAAIVDNADDFKKYQPQIAAADVAIDFSMPVVAADNILRFFEMKIPVVVGTTGWYERLEEIKNQCINEKQSLLYGTNMSLGVNLFFELNRVAAQLLHPHSEYRPDITETHHIHKKDAPSGTAITLANDILQQYNDLSGWTLTPSDELSDKLPITAIRDGEVVGKHEVTYHSPVDEISMTHVAFSREGFAVGAVCAAEWLPGHEGIFTMQDVIKQR
jgi:4-hydroxy-tetrahydrodipicolinate reductase